MMVVHLLLKLIIVHGVAQNCKMKEPAIHSHQSFMKFWDKNYPETPPINYLFKHNLKNRWLRIHSLPASKRYADTKGEWDILLHRQNTIISDLITENSGIKVVVNFIEIDNYLFKSFNFINIGVFKDRENETVFQSFLFETSWQTNTLNPLLIMVAQEEMRAFIIGDDCLIAPYDGGVDLILKDGYTKGLLKEKYKNWLSEREDGL
jgi:hypothetical protein